MLTALKIITNVVNNYQHDHYEKKQNLITNASANMVELKKI